MSKKLTIENVKNVFEEGGCLLISDCYKNNLTKMDYICNCGNYSKISFSNFKNGKRCRKCGHEKTGISRRNSHMYVKKFFEDNGCKLLSKYYKNNSTRMNYICICGNMSEISFGAFQQGHRCRKCGVEKLSGKNSVHYLDDKTDEDRFLDRHYPEYNNWRTDIYKKDNYTCHKCSQRGVFLNAHHIQNYATHKKLRLDMSNGITLCKLCHDKFHSKYGKKQNNKNQVEEFLKKVV